jgi:hypothetical protein
MHRWVEHVSFAWYVQAVVCKWAWFPVFHTTIPLAASQRLQLNVCCAVHSLFVVCYFRVIFALDYLSLCRTTVSGCRWVIWWKSHEQFIALSVLAGRSAEVSKWLCLKALYQTLFLGSEAHNFTGLHASPNGTVTLPDDTQSDNQFQCGLRIKLSHCDSHRCS